MAHTHQDTAAIQAGHVTVVYGTSDLYTMASCTAPLSAGEPAAQRGAARGAQNGAYHNHEQQQLHACLEVAVVVEAVEGQELLAVKNEPAPARDPRRHRRAGSGPRRTHPVARYLAPPLSSVRVK
jgi:hypothetical protein